MTEWKKTVSGNRKAGDHAAGFPAFFFLLSLLLVLLTSCKPAGDVVATLGGKVILTREELMQQAQILDRALHKGKDTLPEKTEKERNKVLLDLAHQLTLEKVIEADKTLSVDSSTLSAAAWQQALQRFGDEQGLMTQLQNLHLTKDAYLESLRCEASEKAHRAAYFAAHPVTEEELLDFYKKNPLSCTLLTYSQVTVPTRAEATDMVEKLKAAPRDIGEYESVVNNDLFDKTSFSRFIDVALNDERVRNTAIFEQTLGTVNFYYDQKAELYLVVYVEGRKDQMKDVRPLVVEQVENRRYLDYLNQLSKAEDLRFYPRAAFCEVSQDVSQ